MLLYQMSQWMSERERLQRELQGDEEERLTIQQRIQELEDRLYAQARLWMESNQDPAAFMTAEPAYEPPLLADPEPGLI